jgi:predicted ATPase with chaperone activity
VRISQLRRVLGAEKTCLQTVDGGYLFQPDETCWLDVDEFQTRISEGDRYQEAGQQPEAIQAYEQARQLYRGDFLPEDLYADMRPAQIRQYCPLDETSNSLMRTAMNQMRLSARAYHRVLKLARTIANLAGEEKIGTAHLAEALQYRPKLGMM